MSPEKLAALRESVLKLNDNSPVKRTELAIYMRCDPKTITRHKKQGYKFEFGYQTTPGHYKAWRRAQAEAAAVKTEAEAAISPEDSSRMEHLQRRLRSASGRSHAPT